MTVFPFPADFKRAPLRILREYRTDITTSRNGSEQRRALRQTPRKSFEYVTGLCADRLRDLETGLIDYQRTQLTLADRSRFYLLAAGLGGGATMVTVNPVPDWMTVDGEVVISSGFRQAIRTITDITGTTVTFAESEATAYPAGARLHAAVKGYLAGSLPLQVHRLRSTGDLNVTFAADPGLETAESLGAAAVTLDGRDVFLEVPDRIRPMALSLDQDGTSPVDYGFGRVAHFFPVGFATQVHQAVFTRCSFDDLEVIRQQFDRAKGQRGEFFMPTHKADLVPAGGLTAAGTTLTVSGTAAAAFNGDDVMQAIAVKTTSGSWICRRISSISSGGLNSTVTVTAAWGSTVAQADIALVCWLPLCRFASDSMVSEWLREGEGNVSLSIKRLKYVSAE